MLTEKMRKEIIELCESYPIKALYLLKRTTIEGELLFAVDTDMEEYSDDFLYFEGNLSSISGSCGLYIYDESNTRIFNEIKSETTMLVYKKGADVNDKSKNDKS